MSVLLEDGEDVLEKIELLVARAGPEIVAIDDEDSLDSPASLTMVTLLFLPNGGLARTISYSPCFPANASLVTTGIQRHQAGDWGDVDEADRRENEASLEQGLRLFSVHHAGNGSKFWIITEADRSSTTILLPEDY